MEKCNAKKIKKIAYILIFIFCSSAFCNTNSEQYLLVTNESLRESFQQLVDRRISQGMEGTLITIEEIESNPEYTGIDIQEKIRNCIRHHYDPNRPLYLVLGGDEHIVPVRYCQTTSDGDPVPVDLYYADMDGTRWDADGDGINGEIGDVNIAELTPEACFGRIPVFLPEEVNAYVSKVIRYETIDTNEFVDSLLLLSGSGYEICYEGPSRPSIYQDNDPVSQKEIEMTDIYLKIIQPYWQPGLLARLFDTNTDWDDSRFGDYSITWKSVLNTMSNDYHYVYYWQHSNSRLWTFRDEDTGCVFNGSHAYRLTNEFPHIIFARGCGTGYFDNSKSESLCEALIKNANGGAVVFFGHARSAGGSPHWDQILRNVFQEAHYRIGEAYKACLISLASQKVSNPWHQYIFILLGDPALVTHHQHKKTLQLFSPKGNEIIEAHSNLTMRWNAGGDFSPLDTVSLFYSNDDGESWNPIPMAENLLFNGCFFTWENCSLPCGSRYQIKVSSNSDPNLYAQSLKSFTIGELGELTIRSFPVNLVTFEGTIRNQTNCTSSVLLDTLVQISVPETIGERTFAGWTDENNVTISENNQLQFFFDRSATITAEYQGERTFYVNDSIAEEDVHAGDDAADGISRETPVKSIGTLLSKYPDLGGGDVIYVSDGTYPEILNFEGKNSGLIIEGTSPERCFLTGDISSTIINIDKAERMSIRNLSLSKSKRGIYANSSNLDIQNCILSDHLKWCPLGSW